MRYNYHPHDELLRDLIVSCAALTDSVGRRGRGDATNGGFKCDRCSLGDRQQINTDTEQTQRTSNVPGFHLERCLEAALRSGQC